MAEQGTGMGGNKSGMGSHHAREYLMGLEDKPLMDEFVALYLGLQNRKLEQ